MGELSAEAPSTRPPPLPEITQLGLITLLLALAAVGWVVTDDRMAGMNTGPGVDLGMPGFYVITWVVMMAAMMFPSITPMVLMYARIQRGKRQRGTARPRRRHCRLRRRLSDRLDGGRARVLCDDQPRPCRRSAGCSGGIKPVHTLLAA